MDYIMTNNSNKAQKIEIMDKILSKSKLTFEDVDEISRKIKNDIKKAHNL